MCTRFVRLVSRSRVALTTLVSVSALLTACNPEKTTAPPVAPAFRLVTVDGRALPAPHSISSTFESGTVYTRVVSSKITFRPDSTYVTAVVLRDSSETNPKVDRAINMEGTYVIADDSLTVCPGCAKGATEGMWWKVPYATTGFTLPLLFSTGTFRAYRYEWR